MKSNISFPYRSRVAAILQLLLIAGSSAIAGSSPQRPDTRVCDATVPVFTDGTLSAGLNTTGFTFGDPIWGDFNNDGYLDLFVDNHYNRGSYLYRSNGNGTFTDIRPVSGLRAAGDRHGSAWTDFDNDGNLDLSITKGARGGNSLGVKQDELYQNLGSEQFSNVAVAAGVTNTWCRGRSVAWGDYDNDGRPDVLLGSLKTGISLYKNNGDGTFTNVTVRAGLAHLRYTDCAFADYNKDGFTDIFATDSAEFGTSKDVLLKNNGDGTFSNVSTQAGILPLTHGRTIAWGDYNNDGNLDLFVARGADNSSVKSTLYKNNGDGTFTEVTDQAGVGVINNSRAAMWGDFDNDGYLDLYVVDSGIDPVGKGANYLYRNNQDGTFTDLASSAGAADLVTSRGRGCAWGDYDNDGFLDLFVTNGEDNTQFILGPQILYHNEGNGNNWLKIKLVGTTSNRQGLGTKITIQLGEAIEYWETNGSEGHFLSQGAPPVHFGLGVAAVVDQITVKWPSGQTQILTNIAADQTLTVTEGQN